MEASFIEEAIREFTISQIERLFPGSRDVVAKLAAIIPWSKFGDVLMEAVRDYRGGKTFLQILKEAVQDWVDVHEEPGEEIRFTLKEGA